MLARCAIVIRGLSIHLFSFICFHSLMKSAFLVKCYGAYTINKIIHGCL